MYSGDVMLLLSHVLYIYRIIILWYHILK